jgi:hypothetical protein
MNWTWLLRTPWGEFSIGYCDGFALACLLIVLATLTGPYRGKN